MPPINVPIFVSSTWLDLMPEREALKNAALSLRGANFTGMEHFGSRDETTQQASLDEVDRSEVYIGIFAGRYGSGITEEEYRHARQGRKPCFIYFKKDSAIPAEWREKDKEQKKRLKKLKAELRSAHTAYEFADPNELARQVTADLHRWLVDNKYLNRAEANAADSPHQLPSPPRDFTGREKELHQLLDQVKIGGVTITGFKGMGGIGKTALALKLADDIKADYPDGQIYLDLKGAGVDEKSGLRQQPLTTVEVMSHVIHAWHREAKLPDDEQELAGMYRTVLAGKRVLLLFDNARDTKQVAPLVPPPPEPPQPGCLMIVTSRQPVELPRIHRLDLEKLTPQDARDLLLAIASRLNGYADQVAELCDYLPMALRPAASALNASRLLKPETLVNRLREVKNRLMLTDIRPEGETRSLSIEASFSLSYKLLNEGSAVDRQKFWRMLAVFPDTFDDRAVAAVWGLDQVDQAAETLEKIEQFSLLEWDASTERFRLHDLARIFAGNRLSESERTACQQRYRNYYLMKCAQPKPDYAVLEIERFNVLWALKQAYTDWQADDASIELANLIIESVTKFAQFLGYSGYLQERIK